MMAGIKAVDTLIEVLENVKAADTLIEVLENVKAADTLIEVGIFYSLSLHMMGMTLTVDSVDFGS